LFDNILTQNGHFSKGVNFKEIADCSPPPLAGENMKKYSHFSNGQMLAGDGVTFDRQKRTAFSGATRVDDMHIAYNFVVGDVGVSKTNNVSFGAMTHGVEWV